MPNEVLSKDIDLDAYPHLKDDLSDIFSIKTSLVDLARELEKDLIILEKLPRMYRLGWKNEVIKEDAGEKPSKFKPKHSVDSFREEEPEVFFSDTSDVSSKDNLEKEELDNFAKYAFFY